MTTKKKNPQDTTLRNARAAKNRDLVSRASIRALNEELVTIKRRLTRLEESQARLTHLEVAK
jgi:hypothetical protein